MHYLHSDKKVKGESLVLKGKRVSQLRVCRRVGHRTIGVQYQLEEILQVMGQKHRPRMRPPPPGLAAPHSLAGPGLCPALPDIPGASGMPESKALPKPSARIRPRRVNRREGDWPAPGSQRAHARRLWPLPLRMEGEPRPRGASAEQRGSRGFPLLQRARKALEKCSGVTLTPNGVGRASSAPLDTLV